MKTLTKAIALASVATLASAAQAEVSVTGGVMSDYVFRGVNTSSGSGYVSVDYAQSGFSAGIWAADIGDQIEADIYLGYDIELDNGFALGAGYTRYEYTGSKLEQDEFDISASIAGFGLNYVFGTADGTVADIASLAAFGQATPDEITTALVDAGFNPSGIDTDADYTVITLSYDAENWGVLVGQVDVDEVGGFDVDSHQYNWAQISTSAEVAGLTVGATVGVQFGAEYLGADGPSNDGYITFDLSKQFDL